ncbi:MAG TPA: LamB/YcsF family protein, partial [Synergistaceae bacterium]|nr:LamB/YcsF family protein [Synergistaceae bacterium]
GVVESAEGKEIHLKVHSICMHGDNPAAVEMARSIRKTLEENGVMIATMREVLKG